MTVFDPVQLTYRELPTNTGDAVNQGWEIEGMAWLRITSRSTRTTV